MNIYEIMFTLQFLVCIGILLAKVYNVISYGRDSRNPDASLLYDFRMAVLLFAVYMLFWGVGMVVVMLQPQQTIYLQLWKLETWSIVLQVVLLLAEIFYALAGTVKIPQDSYYPVRRYFRAFR